MVRRPNKPRYRHSQSSSKKTQWLSDEAFVYLVFGFLIAVLAYVFFFFK